MSGTADGVRDDETAGFDELYRRQWWPMVRLAAGLVDHTVAAEDVVQDAFAALHRRWDDLDDPAAAMGYLAPAW